MWVCLCIRGAYECEFSDSRNLYKGTFIMTGCVWVSVISGFHCYLPLYRVYTMINITKATTMTSNRITCFTYGILLRHLLEDASQLRSSLSIVLSSLQLDLKYIRYIHMLSKEKDTLLMSYKSAHSLHFLIVICSHKMSHRLLFVCTEN